MPDEPRRPAASFPESRQRPVGKSVWLERLCHLEALENWRDSVANIQDEIAGLKTLCGMLAALTGAKGQHEPVNATDVCGVARLLEDRLASVENHISETATFCNGILGDVREILGKQRPA
jgi:hypothetical protein